VKTADGTPESVDDLQAGPGATFFSQSGVLELVRSLASPRRHTS
jgi:hypothetical protein